MDTVLLVLTLLVATLALGTGRTTVLQDAAHLVVFAVFLFLAASPWRGGFRPVPPRH